MLLLYLILTRKVDAHLYIVVTIDVAPFQDQKVMLLYQNDMSLFPQQLLDLSRKLLPHDTLQFDLHLLLSSIILLITFIRT